MILVMAYLNFLSTHDGIGMRPLSEFLPNDELSKFLSTLKDSELILLIEFHKKENRL